MGKKQVRQITHEEMKEYGEYFKSMRQSIGYNLDQMANAIGIFRTSLSKWEKGISIPQTDIKYLVRKYRSVVKAARS